MFGTEKNLKGKCIAILATDGFEESELFEPRKALEDAGAKVEIISMKSGEIKGWKHTDWGKTVEVTKTVDEAQPSDYDALMLPGGVMNPDKLRMNEKAVAFIRFFTDAFKPIAAICHGPWPLIETGFVSGKKMTSWPSLKTDLINAGASWVDEEVVVDRGLVTSRMPQDIPAFNQKMIEEFAEGSHANRMGHGESQRIAG
jgi:protease I